MLRVFVVDDSAFLRKALERLFDRTPDMRVVGSAKSGDDAIPAILESAPDLVTLDLDLPGRHGLQVLRELRKLRPDLPVVILSAFAQEGAEPTLDALALGAADVIDKSQLNVMDFKALGDELVHRLRALGTPGSQARPRRATRPPVRAPSRQRLPVLDPLPGATLRGPTLPPSLSSIDWSRFDLCVVGASTGGPPAVQLLIERMPKSFPVPVLIVQHMPRGFTESFARRLHGRAGVPVTEGLPGTQLLPGHVVIAGAGVGMRVNERLELVHDPSADADIHVPSVDRVMLSAGAARPGRVLGVLLTGMGDDGALGMKALHDEGGLTIAESEETCVIYGMPRAAHLLGGVTHLLPLYDIVDLFGPPR